jgi:uncharacterized membrane protein
MTMPTLPTITVKGWFSTGWVTYRRYFPLLVTAEIIPALLFLPLYLRYITTKSHWLLAALIFLTLMVGLVLGIGRCYLSLKAVRRDDPKIGDLFSPFRRYGHSWLTAVYYLLAVVGGLIMVIIPGIYLAVEYAFSRFAVMDKNLTPREAFQYSAKITEGSRGKIFAAGLVTIPLSILTTQPLFEALKNPDISCASPLLIVDIILSILNLLILSPWINTSFAAAYDSLTSLYVNRQTQMTEGTIV